MLAVYLRRLLGSRRTRSGNRQLGLILAPGGRRDQRRRLSGGTAIHHMTGIVSSMAGINLVLGAYSLVLSGLGGLPGFLLGAICSAMLADTRGGAGDISSLLAVAGGTAVAGVWSVWCAPFEYRRAVCTADRDAVVLHHGAAECADYCFRMPRFVLPTSPGSIPISVSSWASCSTGIEPNCRQGGGCRPIASG